MKDIIRRHIIFHGTVQGVGFRYRSYYSAQRYGLTGWVRNLYDGTVEMEVQGREASIDALILSLDRSEYVWIERMEVKKREIEMEERAFRILD